MGCRLAAWCRILIVGIAGCVLHPAARGALLSARDDVADAEPPPAGFSVNGEPLPPPRSEPPLPSLPFSGRVLEKGSREPLSEIRVIFTPLPPMPPAAPQEALTDAQGRFRLALPRGVYRVSLRSRLIRIDDRNQLIGRAAKQPFTYYVERRTDPFATRVQSQAARNAVSEQRLDADALRRIPGNVNDPLKAVQNLPGVARAPYGLGQLVVWGAAPGDTRIYADGVLIPRAFHFGGLRSTLNVEFISELSFQPGAYGAEFGRGLGGLIDVTTRAPRSDRLHGSVTLDLIDGSVTLEGPLTKKLHVAAGVRISWIAAFLPLFNTSNFQVSPFYWDYQLALRYQPTSRDDLDVFIFGSTDNLRARVVDPDPVANLDIDSRAYFGRALVRFSHRFSAATTLTIMPSILGDALRFDTGEYGLGGAALLIDELTFGYSLRAELSHRFSSILNLRTGVDFEGERTHFNVVAPQSTSFGLGAGPVSTLMSTSQDQTVLHMLRTAPYAIARVEFLERRLTLSPQLRLEIDYQYAYDGEVSRVQVRPEPRLFASLSVIPRYLLVKAGAGLFSQLPTPDQSARVFGNPLLTQAFGATYVIGVESAPTASLSVQGQFFYKDLRSLVVLDPITRYSNDGLGRVIGADFLVRQQLRHGLFGWFAYTVSRSERKDGPAAPWHLFAYDQTHILTLIASYKLPWSRLGLEVGLRFRYVTGNPITPVVGGVRDAFGQNYTAILGAAYSTRLPDFHQLDLRIDKTFLFNRWKLGIFLDIQNLYNRANAESVIQGGRQLLQSAPTSGVPFFPDLGVRADF